MRALGRVTAALVVALVASGIGARAQRLPVGIEDGAIVDRIDIVGNERVSSATVLAKLSLVPGSKFDGAKLAHDIKLLYRNYFLDVRVDSAEVAPGRYALVFRVKEKDFIERVICTGVVEESESEVLDVVQMRRRQFVDRAEVELKARQLEEWYRRKGYHYVQVHSWTRPGKRGGAEAAFAVDEGPEVSIDRIVFRGERSLDDSELETVMQSDQAGVLTSGTFDREVVEADCVRLQEYYRERGFMDAVVTLLDVVMNDAKTGATVVVHVDEGDAYVVDEIAFEGNELFTDVELATGLAQKVGERFDGRTVVGDTLMLLRRYKEQAYLGVDLKDTLLGAPGPKLVYRLDDARVKLVYRITEGQRVRIGRIELEGNDITRDKVILRALTFGPGEYVNIVEVERSIKRLASLGYFEAGTGIVGPVWRDTGRPDVKDLILRFREGPTGNLRLAVGLGSDSGITGLFQVTKQNFDIADWPRSLKDVFGGRAFSGGGQTLVLSAQPGTQISQFTIRFSEPYVFDTPWRFDASLFRRRSIFDSFESDRSGFRLSVGRALDRDLGLTDIFQVNTGYRWEKVRFEDDSDDQDVAVPPTPLRVEQTLRIISLEQSILYSSWDDQLLTTKGFELWTNVQWAGGPFGGNQNFVKTETRGEVGIPIYHSSSGGIHVFGVRGYFGWAEEYGNTDFVPLVERYFLGGQDWLRGFDFQGVGPRDRNGDVTGGQAAWATSVEYRFPLYRNQLRGVLFWDSGTVAERITDDSFDDIRQSLGFGFRITIPALGPTPFAIDFGFPIQKEEFDETRLISFSMAELRF